MTDQDTHTPTDQETALYDALTEGDQQTIEDMRDAAYTADQTPPDPMPDNWASPASQYDLDHSYAWSRYQSDHEAPEQEREENTAGAVVDQNEDAETLVAHLEARAQEHAD